MPRRSQRTVPLGAPLEAQLELVASMMGITVPELIRQSCFAHLAQLGAPVHLVDPRQIPLPKTILAHRPATAAAPPEQLPGTAAEVHPDPSSHARRDSSSSSSPSSSSPPDTQDPTLFGEERPPLSPPSAGKRKRRSRADLPPPSPDFERFWQAYPRKEARLEAWEAWQQLAPHRPGIEQVLAALERCRRSDSWAKALREREIRFIPLPATWLRRGGWDDFPETGTPRRGPPPPDPRLSLAREAARNRILASSLPDPEKDRICDLLDAAPSLAVIGELEGEAGGATP